MATAAATAKDKEKEAPAADGKDEAQAPAAPAKGKKKLIIMGTAAALVLALGGGTAAVIIKKRQHAAAEAAAAAEEEGGAAAGGDHGAADPVEAKPEPKPKKDEHRTPPVFLPLDPFVVNLTDRDNDRFAQVGITLEMADAKAADELKPYMPAIRSGILLVLAHKSSQELIEPEGKEKLALEVRREALRPLGYEAPVELESAVAASAITKKKIVKAEQQELPVKKVHFSSFIIQ